MAARLERSDEPIYAGLCHHSVVEPIQIGVADEEQFLAGETVDRRVMRSRHRGPPILTDVDGQQALAGIAAYQHIRGPWRYCLEAPSVDHANNRWILRCKAIVFDLFRSSFLEVEDGVADLLADWKTGVVRVNLKLFGSLRDSDREQQSGGDSNGNDADRASGRWDKSWSKRHNDADSIVLAPYAVAVLTLGSVPSRVRTHAFAGLALLNFSTKTPDVSLEASIIS